jgi:hypothetical protein
VPARSPDVALRAARILGATQEAHRLRSRRVGTEHLLIAATADPAVRSALLHLGRDLREIQALVTAVSDAQASRSGPVSLSPHAEEVLGRVLDSMPGLDPEDGFVSPAERSRGLGRLLACLLTGPPHTAAHRALTELGLTERQAVLISAVENRAGRRPLSAPGAVTGGGG